MNVRKIFARAVQNWPAKVLSVALALILFIFHSMNTLTTRMISVPLIIETDAALIPASPYPQNIRVNLRGEDAGIKSIADSDIAAYVDLNSHDAVGWYRAPVQVRKKGSALNVGPLEITVNPIEVSVFLDRSIGRTFPLEAVIRGKVAYGFDLVSHSISPAEILVVGPAGSMESFSVLQTEPVDLDGRNGDFKVTVNIVSPNQYLVFRDGDVVEFSGIVKETRTVKNFDNIPVMVAGLDARFTADLGGRNGSVRLDGHESQLDAFRPPPGLLSIDCSGIALPGTYQMPVKVNIPSGFSLIRHDPESVSVVIAFFGNIHDE